MLPDGQYLNLSRDIKFKFAEQFFEKQKPSEEKDKEKFSGLHNLVLDSMKLAPNELHTALKQNIIITGGNSLLKGFHQRMDEQLQEQLKGVVGIYQTVLPEGRTDCCSTFIGGSILGSLSEF